METDFQEREERKKKFFKKLSDKVHSAKGEEEAKGVTLFYKLTATSGLNAIKLFMTSIYECT